MVKGWNEGVQKNKKFFLKILNFSIFFLILINFNKNNLQILFPNTSLIKVENNFPLHPIHLLSLSLTHSCFYSPFRPKLCHEYEL